MQWGIEYTDEFGDWWDSLTTEQQIDMLAAMQILQAEGPDRGRPLVDTIRQSRHHNIKESRPGIIQPFAERLRDTTADHADHPVAADLVSAQEGRYFVALSTGSRSTATGIL